jgi:murein DD-endopeptidase MepM/ murein hydrolase activator NlpD
MLAPARTRPGTPFGWVKGYPLHTNGYPGFGNPPGPGYGFHTGNDFPPEDDPTIYMPEDGFMRRVPWDGKSPDGNAIEVTAGSHRHYLSHASGYLYSTNLWLPKGTAIGIMGDTGAAFGIHVHWAMRDNGKLVDGLKYVNEEWTNMGQKSNRGDAQKIFPALGYPPNDNDLASAELGKSFKDWFYQDVLTHPGLLKTYKDEIAKLRAMQSITAGDVRKLLEASGRTDIPQQEVDYYANSASGRLQLLQNLVAAYQNQSPNPVPVPVYLPVTEQLFRKASK